MNEKDQPLHALQDIRQMMDRSSRFISLSGLSGIGAGMCALVGSWYILCRLDSWKLSTTPFRNMAVADGTELRQHLLLTGGTVFASAILVAIFFTWLRTKKTGTSIWSASSKRLLWNTAVPLLTGGVVVIRLVEMGWVGLIAPLCLLFYGLALLNGSKYTVGEIRWLGFSEIALGLLSLWMMEYGLFFWSIGFGILHILYGAAMWWKYERKPEAA